MILHVNYLEQVENAHSVQLVEFALIANEGHIGAGDAMEAVDAPPHDRETGLWSRMHEFVDRNKSCETIDLHSIAPDTTAIHHVDVPICRPDWKAVPHDGSPVVRIEIGEAQHLTPVTGPLFLCREVLSFITDSAMRYRAPFWTLTTREVLGPCSHRRIPTCSVQLRVASCTTGCATPTSDRAVP